MKTPRTIIFIFLLITFLTLLSGNAYAKNNSIVSQGWGNDVSAQIDPPEIDPPKFSVHPIDGPEDVPLFRAQIKQFIKDLRKYIQDFYLNLR